MPKEYTNSLVAYIPKEAIVANFYQKHASAALV
jgi:hypothetical protein